MPTCRSRLPLRCAAAVLALLCAAATAADDCVHTPDPAAAFSKAATTAAGSAVDIGNITLIELDGDYSRGNDAPRMAVARRFFETHPDHYDFLVVFTTFDFPAGDATAFYNRLRNDTQGIGLAPLDLGQQFGSAARLQGYIDMMAMSSYTLIAGEPSSLGALRTFAHEVLHRWGASLNYRSDDGATSRALIGKDDAHWSYFLDSDASVMYGADWRRRDDGRYESVAVRQRYSALDLYMAGFAAAGEVPPLTLIRGGDGAATDLPRLGAISGGSAETVRIEQIIAAEGPRIPDAAHSPKDFRAALILLRRPGENVPAQTLATLENTRTRLQQHFSQITDGRASMRVFNEPLQTSVPQLPTLLLGSDAAATPPGVAAATAWIKQRQLPDGHWQDRAATALRDTAAALQLLQQVEPDCPGLATARTWVAAQNPASHDARSWKLLADPQAGADSLLAAQSADGGWGIAAGFEDANLDTAGVAEALAGRDANADGVRRALIRLGSRQNGDGSFAVGASGRGRLLPTLRAARLFAASAQPEHQLVGDAATQWIAARQRADGAFADAGTGGSESALADTIELYRLVGRLPLPAIAAGSARDYVIGAQRSAGDWQGSIYLTATAALAQLLDDKANLALQGSVEIRPTPVVDGDVVQLRARVVNSGSRAAAASVARWYDGDPEQGGLRIGNDQILPELAAGAGATLQQFWDSSGRSGTQTLWLQLDADDGVVEHNESDNRVAMAVVVGPAPTQADIALEASRFTLDPAAIAQLPTTVTLSGEVRNLGAAPVPALQLVLYADGAPAQRLAQTSVAVPARGAAPLQLSFVATAAQTLHLRLVADPDNLVAEARENNNEAQWLLPFGPSVDLEVRAADLSLLDGTPTQGRDAGFRVQLRNRGTVAVAAAPLRIRVQQNAVDDVLFDGRVAIDAGQTVERRVYWRAREPGAATLQVSLDAAGEVAELDESNNSASLPFTVAAGGGSDLAVVADSLQFTPDPALQGQPLQLRLRLRNLGVEAAGASNLALFASDPRSGGARLGQVGVAGLAGQAETEVVLDIADLDLAGDTGVYVVADADQQLAEADETNNLVLRTLNVLPFADIAVSSAAMTLQPSQPASGAPLQVSAVVRNLGAQAARNFSVRLYEGSQETGVAVGAAQSVAELAAGAETTLTWNWTFGLQPGARQLTLVADPAGNLRENRRQNNLAILPLALQDSGFYASERHFSPNGDGVRDATALFFARPAGGRLDVVVRNAAGRVVRRFDDVGSGADSGQLVWDGRDERGRIVADGVYRAELHAAGQRRAELPLTVDTDRSSLVAALTGPLLSDVRLPPATNWWQPPLTPATRDTLFARTRSADPLNETLGLYSTSTLLPTPAAVISPRWVYEHVYPANGELDVVDAGQFSPDGRWIAFYLHRDNRYQLAVAATGQTDQIFFLDLDAVDAGNSYRRQPPRFLDAGHVLAGALPQLQVYDLQTHAKSPFRSLPADSYGLRLYPHGAYVWNGSGNAERPIWYVPLETNRPVVTLPVAEAEQELSFTLNADGTRAVVRRYSGAAESLHLFRAESGSETVLQQRTPPALAFTALADPGHLPALQAQWIDADDSLLLIDAAARRVEIRTRDGAVRTTAQLPPTDAALDLGPDPQRFNGEYRRADTLYDGQDCDETHTNCAGASWNATDRRQQWFDPATRSAVVLLASHHIGPVDCEVGRCFGHAPATLEAFAIDVDEGSTTRLAATQSADRLPAGLQPRLRLLDGGMFATDGRYGFDSRLSAQPWRYADTVAQGLPAFRDDDAGLPAGSSPQARHLTAMTNLSALLQAENSGRAVLLNGVAADINFAYYQLDWALPSAPTQWQAITPPQQDPVLGDEFLSWVPPQPGHYLVRLTVVDKAGNATVRTASALSLYGSPVVEVGVDSRYFSPNGDGVKDGAIVHFRSVTAAQIRIRVRNALGAIVREQSSVLAAGQHDFVWDGRDDAGVLRPDGDYSVDVEGQKLRVVLDTVAPVVDGNLLQPNMPVPRAGSAQPDYPDDIGLDVAVTDANGSELRYELRDADGSDWYETPQAGGAMLNDGYDGLAGRRVRVVADDRAGNRTIREFGPPVEQLLFARCDPLTRDCSPLHSYHALTVGPISYPADYPSPVEVDIDRPEGVSLWLQDGTPGLASLQIEMADTQRPGEWSVFATLPGTLPPFAFDYNDRGMALQLPLQNLPQGADRRLRAVGIRADGSRLYGDQMRLRINGLGQPSTLCPGQDPAQLDPAPPPELVAAMAGHSDAIRFVVPLYYDGIAADLQLVVNPKNPLSGSTYRLRPFAHSARHAAFELPAEVRGFSGSAFATLLQAGGRQLQGREADIKCGESSDAQARGFKLTAGYAYGDHCGAAPSGRAWVTAFSEQVLEHYELSLSNGAQTRLLLDETPPGNDIASGWSEYLWRRNAVVDTSALPEGRYTATAIGRRGDATYQAVTPLLVDHDPPAAELLWPSDGSRICAARSGQQDDLPALRFAVDLRSESDVQYQIELAARDFADSSYCYDGGMFRNHSCRFDRDDDWLPATPAKAEYTEFDGQVDPRVHNGIVDLKLHVANASGAVTCSSHSFHLDSGVDLGLSGAPEPALGTMQFILPLIPGEPQAEPRPPLLGLSVNGATRFRQATIPLVAREPLDYRASVHSVIRVVENGSVSYYPGNELWPLSAEQDVVGGFQVGWDGRINGAAAADDYYLIVVKAQDTCGWSTTQYYAVDLDSTAPQLAITDPPAGAVPTEAVVAVRGQVDDVHFSSFPSAQPYWELTVAQAGTVELVGHGEDAVPQPAVLGRWSRGAAQQAGQYRLVAADDFGNRSEISLPFAAPTPLALLARAQLQPELFSPNGDGRLDRSELRIDLLAAARVDLRIRDGGGAVVATLAQATPLPAGTTRLDWNGSGLPDGRYSVEIAAESVAAPELRETAVLGAVLDTQAPQLSIVTPAGDIAGAGTTITFRLDEPHPDRFDARLLSDSGAVQAQLAGGGSGVQTLAALGGRADGRYRIAIQAQDRAGNRGEIEQSFVLDTAAPQAVLTAPAAGSVLPRGGAAVHITGTATDAQLESYRVELLPGSSQNGVLLASGSSAVEAAELGRWNVTEADGDYRLRLRVRDRAGNESSAEQRIAVDGTPPQVVIDTPANGAALAGRLRLLGTVEDAHLRDYIVAIATPSAALADNWTPLYRGLATVSAGVLAEIDLPLPDGDYVLRVLATDVTGAATSARLDLRLDRTPPPAPLQLRVRLDGADAVLDWTPPTAGDLAGYAVYRNGARLNAAVLTTPHYVDTALPDGRWRYEVTALDQAGNESATSNRVEVSVDRTPPEAQILAPASGARVHGVVPVIATAYSVEDFDSFVLTARRRDGGDTPRVLAQGGLPLRNQLLVQWDSLAFADETAAVLRLSARDRSGNEAAHEIDVVVDNLPPAAPQGLVASLQGNDAAVAWNANGEADLLGYLLYRNGQLVNGPVQLPADLRGFALPANAYTDAALADGLHQYVVFAIDQAGNISAPSTTASVGPLDNGPPHLNIDAPDADTAFETRIDVRASSRDRDIASVQFAWRAVGAADWTAIGAALTEAPYRVSWAPGNLPHGDYEVRALAIDSGGRSDPQPPQVRVRYADLTPPSPPGALQATADGDLVQLSWSASPSEDVVAYRIERHDGSTWQPVADTSATTAGDSGVADGRWSYRVRALDAGGNLSAERGDTAEVFSLNLQTPFTPTAAATVNLQGRSALAGQIGLRNGNGAEQAAGATAADGRFTLDGLALADGSNSITLRVTSADGDRSRSAVAQLRRSGAPAAPSGLQAVATGSVVDLSWNANGESDLLGYRAQHNGGYVQTDDILDGLSASSPVCCDAVLAADGHAWTVWDFSTTFEPLADDGATDPPLEIDLGAAQIVSALELDWSDADSATGNIDLYARSEYGDWLRLAQLRRSRAATYVMPLPQPYRSDRLRLVVRAPEAAGGDAHLRLAEVRVRAWHLQTATTLQQNVLDGTHRYRVAAVNAAAQQSAWSTPAEVGIGDTTPPDAVVLSGSVQDDTATLSWTASNAADVARYVLTRNGTPVAEVAAGAERRHADAHLPLGSYAYEVVAYDAFDNASLPSNRVNLTVSGSGPGVPVALAVTAPPQGRSLDVSWNAGAGTAPVRYLLRRATATDGPYTEIATPTATSFADAPLADGTRYYYTVEAVDIAGNRSGASAPASGVPRDLLPPAPPVLTYPTGGDGRLRLAADRSLVCGRAEPGSLVQLQRDGVAAAATLAAVGADYSDYPAVGTYLYSWLQIAADGWHLLDNGYTLRILDLRSGEVETVTSGSSLAQWSAQGLTLYYLQDGQIRAKPAGRAAETLPLQAEAVQNFAIAADESRVLLLGRLATGSASAADGLWWLRRDGSDAGAIAGFAGHVPDPDHALLLRADARYAAVRATDTQLLLVDLASRRVIDAFAADLQTAPRWMPDGNLAFTRSDNGAPVLWRYDVAARHAEARFPLPDFTQSVAWAPDGSEFAVLGSGRVQGRSAADGALQFDLNVPGYDLNAGTFAWAPTGRLVFIASDGSYPPHLYSVQPPGAFCAGPLPLQAGSNRIDATASDAAGNRSGLSRPIWLDVDGAALPDLALSAADLFLLPATPAPGQSATALATVRNRGAAAAAAVVVAAELSAPDGSRRTLPPPAPLNLAAGEAKSLSLDLGVLAQAGYYRLRFVVDPAAQIAESDESNNSVELPFAVSGGSDPLLDVSVENRVLAPAEHLRGEARVTNPGNPFSGRVRTRVLAADGSLVADLGEANVSALGSGQIWTRALDWDSRGTLAGDYRLQAQLLRSDGSSLELREAAFTIAAVRRIALAVTALPAAAPIGTAVAIDSRLQFEAGNALLTGAVLRTSVRNPAGAEVWAATQSLGTLQPDYQLSKVDTWTTQGAVTGVHTVHLELTAAGLAQSSETSLALFEPAAPMALRGAVSLAPAARLVAGQPGELVYRIDNAGAAALNGLSLRLRVLRSAAQPAVFEREELIDLGAGAGREQRVAIAAPPLALDSYIAVLDARLAGDAPDQWRDLARTSFVAVDETAPEITVLTPVPGQLQPALVNLRAQIVDRHADVALAQVRVDTGAWQALATAADGSWSLRLAGLADGTHSLLVRARDRWGNESQSAPLAFEVDAGAPQIDIAGVAEGALLNQPVAPSVTITDAHLDTAQTSVRLNGQAYVSGTAITADGDYTIAVQAVDTAGNQSLASRHFTLDSTPPLLAIASPADGSVVASSTIAVQVDSEAGAEVRVNVGAYQAVATAGTNGQAQFAGVPLVEGLNRIEAIARDAAGNASAPQAVNVRYEAAVTLPLIGTLQPAQAELAHGEDLVVALQLRNPGTQALADQSLRLRVLGADGTPLAQRDYARAFAGGETFSDKPQFATTSWPLGRLDLQLDLLYEGSWRRLATQSLQLVDRTPPQLQALAPPEAAIVAAPLRLRATASDALSAPVTVEASVDDGAWTALSAASGPAGTFESTALTLADGAHHYALRARDAAGNETPPVSIAFTVDSTPPQIAISGVADGDRVNHAVTPLIAFSDAHLRTTGVRLNGQPYVSGTPVEHSGDYSLQADADDAAGNTAARTVTFTVDLDAPAVLVTEPAPDSTVTSAAQTIAGTTEPLADVAVDAPGLTTVVRADASGAFRTAAATLLPGDNTLRLRATDRAGNVGPERVVQVRYQPPTGEALSAQFLHGALSLRRGDPLSVNFRLHNDGVIALTATPLRVQLRDAAGDIVAQHNDTLSLGVGAEALREASFTTAALSVGRYRVEIVASLRDAQGQAAWTALADIEAVLRRGCPPAPPADLLFRSGFDDDALFCDDFEPAAKRGWSGVPGWLSLLLAPAPPSPPASAGAHP
ncbi:MAG: hypothetical protein BGP24_19365 [Lysobacterales bacterium 69-70]|nr:Ig-like domain repeat protein [Xanthomonadaceae bacterium]OJY93025.1 MAG: hypothetical protein BGP24_19365 [Xanthomonadales bacterium 69-70]